MQRKDRRKGRGVRERGGGRGATHPRVPEISRRSFAPGSFGGLVDGDRGKGRGGAAGGRGGGAAEAEQGGKRLEGGGGRGVGEARHMRRVGLSRARDRPSGIPLLSEHASFVLGGGIGLVRVSNAGSGVASLFGYRTSSGMER